MQVFFERREELVPGIWQHYFRPERPVRFEPGQYVTLQLLGVANDPRGAGRTLTLTSLPNDPLLSFVTKDQPVVSPYKQALGALQPDDSAIITDPMGDLVLPKDPAVPLVFIAGGIGISSYVSMLAQLTTAREERAIYLFYALTDRREQIFRELIDGYPLQLKTLAIKPNRLTAQAIKASTPPEALIYISGSQPFVEGLRTAYESLGTPRSQIVFDYYDGYAEL
jgi:ferredoxin-NADP reductase